MTFKMDLRLTKKNIKSLAITYEYDTTLAIRSLDFGSDGQACAAATEKEIVIFAINTHEPTPQQVNVDNCTGSDIVKFLNGRDRLIHSTIKDKFLIRLLNHSKQGYERYFPGHSKLIKSISIEPRNLNTFLSSSEDKSIRYWDTRSQNRLDMITEDATPFVDFHPSGTIFSAAIGSSVICNYDVRFMKKPSQKWNIEKEKNLEWTGMMFSSDGESLLISTNQATVRTYNPVTGEETGKFLGHSNKYHQVLEAHYLPLSNFIVSGSSDGLLHFWDASTGRNIAKLRGYDKLAIVQCVKFNKQFMMMATASNSELKFWVEKN